MSIKSELSLPTSTDCQRIFHGRGHCFPGYEHVNIDWYNPVIFITLYKPHDVTEINSIANFLADAINEANSVMIQHRYRKPVETETLLGETHDQLIVSENNLKFELTLTKNQNTGLFLDMKNGREWVYSNAEKKSVLNLFAYTCAFSVAAIAGGASKVTNIDISKSSLAKGRTNHQLNKQDKSKIVYEGVDIFKSYNRLKKHGPYDILVCDPPTFQSGSVDIERDYKKIIRRIPQLLKSGGQALLCLNSPDLDQSFLLQTVEQECPTCHFVGEIKPPAVFKESEPGKGLKALLFEYRINK